MRRSTNEELKEVKKWIANPLTIWTYTRSRKLVYAFHTLIDPKQTDFRIDSEALRQKINQLKKYYNN